MRFAGFIPTPAKILGAEYKPSSVAMHWVDKVARGLLKRGKNHVIASGISISGHIHIGHCNDVFIADGICRAVEGLGARAKAIWFADDYDPMRRIPWPLNEGDLAEKYKQYLGMPYSEIPSPDPKYKNFVDFFSRPFIESLDDFGIRLKVYSGAEAYKSGRAAGLIRTALKRASEIREILNRYRDKPLPENWLPFDVICEKCGRIATTRAISWHGDYVRYRCEGSDYVAGCGHEGEADYTRGGGKLTWRVEWPARWKLLKVTCEPFGKDHAAAGGSYDTGKLIAKKVFGCDAPYPLPYEWVSLKGKPMSSSEGIVFTLPQWLSIAEPELLRYFIFRSKPMKEKGFDPGLPLLDFYDEYDRTEEVYFKKVRVGPSKRKQLKRIYELSQPERVPRMQPQRVSFRFAAVLSQVAGGDEKRATDILVKRRFFVKPTASDRKLAMGRLACARNWASEYAPERLRFTLLGTLPAEIKQTLTPKQRQGLKRLAADLSSRDFTPVELHNHIYAVSEKVGLKAAELFKAVYLVLVGKAYGPRAGSFILALNKDFVVQRFREVAQN